MKIEFSKKIMIMAAGAALMFSACENSPYPGYEKAESGLYYKFHTQAENAVKPKEGDFVRLIMSYKNSKDSVLFDSKADDPRKPAGMNYIEFPVQKSTFKGSFEDAIYMMGVGDSASFIINADSVYLTTFKAPALPAYIEKGSMLTFDVKLLKITSKADADAERSKQMEEQQKMIRMKTDEELEILSKYIADNKITVKPTASGLYYIETKKGKGAKPQKGQVVKVNYAGRLLDGTIFDTSDEALAKKEGVFDERRMPYEPIEFPVGLGQVIPGWDEGLLLMNVGSKGKLIIPSSIGYGPSGSGPIPAFATLIFDVELIGISESPAGTPGE